MPGDVLVAMMSGGEERAEAAYDPTATWAANDRANAEAGGAAGAAAASHVSSPAASYVSSSRGGREGSSSTPGDDNVCFDFIDCSNVSDYVSLPSLLLGAAPLLSHRASHGRLRLESLVALLPEGEVLGCLPDPSCFP